MSIFRFAEYAWSEEIFHPFAGINASSARFCSLHFFAGPFNLAAVLSTYEWNWYDFYTRTYIDKNDVCHCSFFGGKLDEFYTAMESAL